MNTLLQTIKDDLKTAMTAEIKFRKAGLTTERDFENAIAHKTVSRAIISMIPELGKKPHETTVEDIQRLLRKYISNERERELYKQKHITEADVDGISSSDLKKLVKDKIQELDYVIDTLVIIIAGSYLPIQATEEEIQEWIADNIDFSKFKNKMQAMGPIMKRFSGADGNFIKGILMKF